MCKMATDRSSIFEALNFIDSVQIFDDMGILDMPGKLIHNYFRMVGLMVLIVFGLLQRLWRNIKPALAPIINVYDTINRDNVSISVVMQEVVKLVLVVAIMYYKAAMAVWDTVSKPFHKQVDSVYKFFEELNSEYSKNKKDIK